MGVKFKVTGVSKLNDSSACTSSGIISKNFMDVMFIVIIKNVFS